METATHTPEETAEALARFGRELTTGMLLAQEEERKRVARELHDETIQSLSTLLVNLDHVERQIMDDAGDRSRPEWRCAFERLRSIVTRTLDETRALAQALRPTVLDDLGLAAALEGLADEYRQTYGIEVEIDVPTETAADERLSPEIEIALFRVAQEALKNACHHGHARRARVRLAIGVVAELTIEDDGDGFDTTTLRLHSGAPVNGDQRSKSGLGLGGMQERAAILGGVLTIASTPGRGTCITLLVPLVAAPGVAATAEMADPHTLPPGGAVVPRLDRAAVARVATLAPGMTPLADGMPRTIRLLLVDDHAVFREGLSMILNAWPGMIVVGEAEDGRQALDLVECLRPDVVVMDIAMPNLNGLDATRQISRRFPEVRVVILTTYESRPYLARMVQVGATACILKRSAGTELVAAVRAAAEGKSYVSPTIAGAMLDDYRLRIDKSGDDLLTEREREVLQLVVEGRTNQEIADQLVLSVKTVQTHRAHILRKLGAHDRGDLVKHAISVGMIPSETL